MFQRCICLAISDWPPTMRHHNALYICRRPKMVRDNALVYRKWVRAPQSNADAGLGSHVAVSSRIQGLAAAIGRGHASRHEHDRCGPVHGQVHARGQTRAAATWLHGLADKVHSHQRRGAGCVDGHARALQQHVKINMSLSLLLATELADGISAAQLSNCFPEYLQVEGVGQAPGSRAESSTCALKSADIYC